MVLTSCVILGDIITISATKAAILPTDHLKLYGTVQSCKLKDSIFIDLFILRIKEELEIINNIGGVLNREGDLPSYAFSARASLKLS